MTTDVHRTITVALRMVNRRPYNGPRPAQQQNEGTPQNNRNEGRQPQQTERKQE